MSNLPATVYPTPSTTLDSADYVAQSANAARYDNYKVITGGIQTKMVNDRTAGITAVWGSGQSAAQDAFARMGAAAGQEIALDVLAAFMLNLRNPGTGPSPVPSGLTLVLTDASGNPINISTIEAAIEAALAPLLATGVTVTVGTTGS